jgi:hypothetical protein
MRTLLRWLAFAAVAILPITLGRSAMADPAPDYGHLLAYGDEYQVYATIDQSDAVFSAILPTTWTYTIDVDADGDGKWGYGPMVQSGGSKPRGDFAYAAAGNDFCPQYIYSSIPSDPDMIASRSYCGERRSGAKFTVTSQPNNRKLAVYTIPLSEIRMKSGNVEFAVELYDGTSFWYFGSPQAPFELSVPSGP